jgi:hypothetical protein
LAALSAELYVPLRRIGFLVMPVEHSTSKAVRMSDFAEKIKTQRAFAAKSIEMKPAVRLL